MKIKIQSIGFRAKKELREFIKEKSGKLFGLSDEIISCEVALKVDKSDTMDNKVCNMRLIIPGNDLLAASQAESFEKAAAQAMEALKTQIRRRKKNHLNRKAGLMKTFVH